MALAPEVGIKRRDDVNRRLVFFATILIVAATGAFVATVLTPDHRASLLSLFRQSGALGPTAIAFCATAIVGASWVLVDVMKVHSHFYDRYFVKFKRRHDVEFLLPRLLSPF